MPHGFLPIKSSRFLEDLPVAFHESMKFVACNEDLSQLEELGLMFPNCSILATVTPNGIK